MGEVGDSWVGSLRVEGLLIEAGFDCGEEKGPVQGWDGGFVVVSL
jgi:hypothetical protein